MLTQSRTCEEGSEEIGRARVAARDLLGVARCRHRPHRPHMPQSFVSHTPQFAADSPLQCGPKICFRPREAQNDAMQSDIENQTEGWRRVARLYRRTGLPEE